MSACWTIAAGGPEPSVRGNKERLAALAKSGRDVASERALDRVFGYSVGLDVRRRDLRRAMGEEDNPWEVGKSFDPSALLGSPATVCQDRPPRPGRDLAQGQR